MFPAASGPDDREVERRKVEMDAGITPMLSQEELGVAVLGSSYVSCGAPPAANENLPRDAAVLECKYREKDFPWTHYFNGEAMPRWSSCWHLIPTLLDRAEELMNTWEEPVKYDHLWRLYCRLDHCGQVESEEPDIFQVCCLTLAFIMLRDEAEFLAAMSDESSNYGGTPEEIFGGVRAGLFAMHLRCVGDGLAFWTNGDGDDLALLTDAMRRHRLPRTDPEWFEPPHIGRNRAEIGCRIEFTRKDILSLLGSRPFPKDVRRLIHSLPRQR